MYLLAKEALLTLTLPSLSHPLSHTHPYPLNMYVREMMYIQSMFYYLGLNIEYTAQRITK